MHSIVLLVIIADVFIDVEIDSQNPAGLVKTFLQRILTGWFRTRTTGTSVIVRFQI